MVMWGKASRGWMQLLFICSTYIAICENHDDILRGGDDLSATLKRTPSGLSLYLFASFTYRDIVLQSMNIPD